MPISWHLSAGLHVSAVSSKISIHGSAVNGGCLLGEMRQDKAGKPLLVPDLKGLKKVTGVTSAEICSDGTKLQSAQAINLLRPLICMEPPLLFQWCSWHVRLIDIHCFS